jgi:hypothetical protein
MLCSKLTGASHLWSPFGPAGELLFPGESEEV